MRPPPLALEPALALLLPTDEESALLRAALHTGPSAGMAWRCWRSGRPEDGPALCSALSQWRTLLPLLHRSIVRNGFAVEPEVRDYARATALREELRAERYAAIAAEALSALDRAGIAVTVVRGAALAATVYESWPLRHCHDLDLLVAAGDLEPALHALADAGFARGAHPSPRTDGIAEHASGLEVSVHTLPFAVACRAVCAEALSRDAEWVRIGGVRARVPSPAAMLVHVLGHASYSASRRHLRWVADAWHLAAGPVAIDWDEVRTRVAVWGLDLPVAVLLDYLAALGVPVPPEALAAVRARAVGADRVAEDVALGGVLAATQGRVLPLWRSMPSWHGRLRLLRWAVAPTPAYLRSACGVSSEWLVPVHYVRRPLRFVAGALLRRMPSGRATGAG